MNTGKTTALLGWVDNRRRALVNLRVWRDRTACALVDTGFNGYLLWESTPADLPDFGETSSLYEEIEIAGGRVLVMLRMTRVQWFDEEGAYSEIESFLLPSDKPVRPGDPVVLLGTALLSGKVLSIDFGDSTVRIQASG